MLLGQGRTLAGVADDVTEQQGDAHRAGGGGEDLREVRENGWVVGGVEYGEQLIGSP
jgi:hypothetical protein